MWLPQGGALKIENLQFTQYCSIIMLYTLPILNISHHCSELITHSLSHTDCHTQSYIDRLNLNTQIAYIKSCSQYSTL